MLTMIDCLCDMHNWLASRLILVLFVGFKALCFLRYSLLALAMWWHWGGLRSKRRCAAGPPTGRTEQNTEKWIWGEGALQDCLDSTIQWEAPKLKCTGTDGGLYHLTILCCLEVEIGGGDVQFSAWPWCLLYSFYMLHLPSTNITIVSYWKPVGWLCSGVTVFYCLTFVETVHSSWLP